MYEQLEQKEVDYARGKISGDYVQDDQGNIIISPGELITEQIINKARETGQLHYLMLAAASGVMKPGSEDLAQRLMEFGGVMEGNEANFVLNRQAGREVKDFEGNVIVREGDVISNDIIQLARDKGLLQRLVLAVGAPGLSIEHEDMAEEDVEDRTAARMGYKPYQE